MKTLQASALNHLWPAVIAFMLWGLTAGQAGGLVAAWGDGPTTLPVGVNSVKAISTGFYHALAIKSDGSLIGWGDNLRGEISIPAGLSRVKAVAAGDAFSLALKPDGTVIGWGDDYYGQSDVPAGLSNVVAIAAGGFHNLALRADGSVVAWGDYYNGQTSVPTGLSNVVAVAAGRFHSLALKADGSVVAWGACSYGWASVPTGLSNVVAIAAGGNHDLALKADGGVVAWGDNSYGQTNLPAGLSNVAAIAAGGNHSFALVSDGPIQISRLDSHDTPYTSNATFSVVLSGREPLSYQWLRVRSVYLDTIPIPSATNSTLTFSNAQFSDIGTYVVIVSNTYGAVLSMGATLTVISPPFITAQSPSQTVRAGADVSMWVLAQGTPSLRYEWFFNGTNLAGATWVEALLTNVQPSASGLYSVRVTNVYGSTQVDLSLTVTDTPPYIVSQPVSQSVPVGASATFTVSARGSLPFGYQWRFNGQDISGATSATLTLSNLSYSQTGYYDVAVRNPIGHVVSAKVLLSVGQTSVYVWGLGSATNGPPGLTNAVAVAAGYYHVLALKRDGTVATWGASYYCLPSVTNVPPSVTNVVAIAAGANSSMALRADGTVVVWGDNSYGQTSVPAAATNVVAIADGSDHCLVLKSNGAIVGWGNNSFGQTNVPTGLSNVVGIAAGYLYSLAVKDDGTVVAWGHTNAWTGTVTNAWGPPAGLTNVIAVSPDTAADYYNMTSLALKTDGGVVAWGYQSNRMPPNVSYTVAISAGHGTGTALKSDGSVISSGFASGFPSSVSNVIAIASGGNSFMVAVVGDGSPFITIQPVSQTTTTGATVRLHARAVGAQQLVWDPQRYQWRPQGLGYQWQLNGMVLPGATNADLTIANVQGTNTGKYQVVVTNALGSVISRIAQLTIPFNTTLPAALNATNLVWTSSPTNAPWFAQISVTHDGEAAAQSGHITDNQQSALQTTVTGPGVLVFWWKVSSEEGYDFLKL
jgi:alpha-tubulin suppressor-like RCC1 family protein